MENKDKNTIAPNGAPSLEQTEKAVAVIKEMVSQTSFFAHMLSEGNCSGADIDTHLSLIRYNFENLSAALGHGQFLSEKLEETTAMLRDANAKISEMESKLADTISTEAAVERINTVEDWFATWYSLCGFHYASIKHTSRGFYAEFSEEIDRLDEEDERTNITFGKKELAVQIASLVPYQFSDKYQLFLENYHMELLDCDKNRELLTTLFEETFPDASIVGFHSRKQSGGRHGEARTTLRVEVYLPYTSITAWYDQIMKERETRGDIYHGGKLYAKKAQLTYNLTKSTCFKHMSEKQKQEAAIELEQISKITELWDEFCNIPVNDENCIETGWQNFQPGTSREDVWHWFEEQFNLSVAKDLMGLKF